MYKNKSATNARARKDSQRRRRDCPNDCRDSCTSYPRYTGPTQCASLCETPGVNSLGHRTAARLTGRQTTTPACSPESDSMREAQPAIKSQQHLGGADYTRTAAVRCCVYASLAPAQPPPPAGLASGLTCISLPEKRMGRKLLSSY